jgi:HD superfamily phosphodiesterase
LTTSTDRPRAKWFVRPDGFDASTTIHGMGHTRRVHIHSMALGETLGLVPGELEALSLAALWHDIGRTHDGADYYHGAKSAGKVVGLGLHEGVDPYVLDVALFAVTHHCGDEGHAERAARYLPDFESGWRIFEILKDADALDRVRLHRNYGRLGGLDPSFLRFDESHNRIERALELLEEIK